MKLRLITCFSAALNLALAVGIFVCLHRAQEPGTSPVAPVASPPAAVPSSPPVAAPTSSPVRSPAFTWSQIASEDLKIYRDHLLAVKCPKLTVHDIILGEINERFDQRRQAVLNLVQSQFWDFAVRGEQALRNEWAKPIEALAAERQKLIDDVLGNDPAIAETGPDTVRDTVQQEFEWLPSEKRDQLLSLEQRRQHQLDEWSKSVAEHPNGQATPEDNARLQELDKEYADARKELFTPEELEEIRLRSSKESLWAIGLSGFEPTETEWRAVVKLRVDTEEAQQLLNNSSLSAEERGQREEELQAELTRATKEVLGPDRFNQYEAANDAQFQDVVKVTQRYGLSNEVAYQAYDLQQAVLKQANEIRGDSTVSDDARQAALAELQQETERALSTTLGDKVLSTYKQYGGTWIKDLSQ
jgi:hypothetical protein